MNKQNRAAYHKLYQQNNRERIALRQKKHRERNYKRLSQQAKDYYKRNKKQILQRRALYKNRKREMFLKRKYGIGQETYLNMVEEQSGLCAICGNPPSFKGLYIDHDHKSGRVRGLLCNKCNTGIAMLLDDDLTLNRASLYLRRYQ